MADQGTETNPLAAVVSGLETELHLLRAQARVLEQEIHTLRNTGGGRKADVVKYQEVCDLLIACYNIMSTPVVRDGVGRMSGMGELLKKIEGADVLPRTGQFAGYSSLFRAQTNRSGK